MDDIDREFQELLDSFMEEDDGVNPNSPIPIEQQQAARRAEYEQALQFEDLQKSIEFAVQTLQAELLPQLSQDAAVSLFEDLYKASERLQNLTEEEAMAVTPKVLGISMGTVDEIHRFAQDEYGQGHHQRAEALFTLLTVLHSQQWNFWFGRAAASQALQKPDEAALSYQVASDLDPTIAVSYILCAECYIEMRDDQAAKESLDQGLKLIESQGESSEDLQALVHALKQKVGA